MTPRPQRRVTLDHFPSISQKLRLVCRACGQRHTYDVGRIFLWKNDDRDDPAMRGYAFSNYFHCRDCGSAGPWEVDDYLKLLGWTLRAHFGGGDRGVTWTTPKLFDGTLVQTPAMGEAHLLRLIAKDPKNAFLHTRLGNVFRGCHRRSDAATWYAKALALDEGDLEARYQLFWFAADAGDYAAAVELGLTLVRQLLEGRTAPSDELTCGIATSVVEMLREAPDEFRASLLDRSGPAAETPETCFVRTLLEQEGDEDRIVQEATERILSGEPAPDLTPDEAALLAVVAKLGDEGAKAGPPIDPISSLGELVEQEGLDVEKLTVAVRRDANGRIRVPDWHAIYLFDGKKAAVWNVPSLRELFRGDQAPPPDMDRYPTSYVRALFCIEKHVLTLCDAEGDRTDQEMEPVYSALRRRPDGKNHLGFAHDILWQAAALMLGLHRLSGAEFEAIVGALERSVRRWALRPVSRNYVSYLRKQME